MNPSQVLPVEDPFATMDPQIAEDATAQMNGFDISDEFTFCGEHFVIRVLLPDEELAASIATKPYRDTLKEAEAWANAQVGMALASVNYDQDFCPPTGPSLDDYARARLKYVSRRWFQPTLDFIYRKYVQLQIRQQQMMTEMESLSHRSLHTSSPFVDSSTKPGASLSQTDLEESDSTNSKQN